MEIEGSGAVAVSLKGFVLRAAVQEHGELWQLVETTTILVGCPGWGTRARSKGRAITVVRGIACGGRPVRLAWRQAALPRRRLRYQTWTEATQAVASRAAVELAEHLRRYPVSASTLVFTSRENKPLNRNYFNSHIWRPALLAAAVEPSGANGMHALRHFYASVLIDAGESVKAVAEYLGHADPGFTLRVYAHLPSSEDRARHAVDRTLSAHGGCRRPCVR